MHNQAADTLPEPIRRYGVTGKFGEGRMEVACKPHDAQLDQPVTIKMVCEAIDDAVAAFVQADCLVERGLAGFEPRDDRLKLLQRVLERQLFDRFLHHAAMRQAGDEGQGRGEAIPLLLATRAGENVSFRTQ